MTIEAGNQMKHKMLKLPNGQKKVYNDVFNAYLTPNSLDFLSQNGISKNSVAQLYKQRPIKKRTKGDRAKTEVKKLENKRDSAKTDFLQTGEDDDDKSNLKPVLMKPVAAESETNLA